MIDFLVRRAGIITAILFAAFALAAWVRPLTYGLSAPAELSYVPDDATSVILVPSIDELAAQLHVHACPYLKDSEAACVYRDAGVIRSGPISNILQEAFYDVSDSDQVAVYALLATLGRFGIDTTGAGMLALRGPAASLDFVAVASLVSGTGCDQLEAQIMEQADEIAVLEESFCLVSASSAPNAVIAGGSDSPDIYFKMLRQNRVAIYTDAETFSGGAHRNRSASRLLSYDNFAKVLDDLTSEDRPAAWGYSRAPGATLATPMMFVLSFTEPNDVQRLKPDELAAAQMAVNATYQASFEEMEEPPTVIKIPRPTFIEGGDQMRLSLWLAPNILYSKTLNRLMTRDARRPHLFSDLGYGGGVSLHAEDAMQYARFAGYGLSDPLADALFDGDSAPLSSFARYKSTFEAALINDSIHAVDIQLAGFRDRIPDFVIRFEIDEAAARDLILNIQTDNQIDRDRQIVSAAQYLGGDDSFTPQTISSKSGFDALARQARIDVASTPGNFRHLWGGDISEAFESDVYAGQLDAEGAPNGLVRYHYLQPPILEDDFRFRFESALAEENAGDDPESFARQLAEARTALIEQQKFRMISAYDPTSGILWIASDKETLERVAIERTREYSPGARLTSALEPERVVDLMRAEYLSEDDELPEEVLSVLEELSEYASIKLQLDTLEKDRGARLDITFNR